jgi:endonuclease/exonuclease/phosphatase family metal-dependent hydrolase
MLAISTAGCGSEACEQAPPLTLATFNAGLAAADVEYAPERAEPVAEALAAQRVDVLCVQEFWSAADWDRLIEAAGTNLPNVVRRDPLPQCASGCLAGETDPVATCAAEPCAGLTGVEYLGCADSHCGAQQVLSGSCIGCLLGEATADGGATETELAERCAIPPDQSADAYLFDCSYDTGILTSGAVVHQESRPLDSFMVLSTVDHARIATEAGEVDVFCAHLQSEMGFPYQGDFGSYEAEQAHQIDQLLAFIGEKDDGSRPVVLMGDLNTGPAIPEAGVVGEWPHHYQRFVTAGFANPHAESGDASCSYCPENTFQSDSADPRLLDHILLKNATTGASCTRFMTETTTIESKDGDLVETHYSDHFGLQATLESSCGE